MITTDPNTAPDTINSSLGLCPATAGISAQSETTPAPLVPEYIYIPEDVDNDDLSGGTGIYLYDE
jgi:hypothetical protein